MRLGNSRPHFRKLLASLVLSLTALTGCHSEQRSFGCGQISTECMPYARLLAPLPKTRDAWLAEGGLDEKSFAHWKERAIMGGDGIYVSIKDGEVRCSRRRRQELSSYLTLLTMRAHASQVHVAIHRPDSQTRLYSELMLLHRAVTRFPNSLPDMDFVIGNWDVPVGGPFMSFCRHNTDNKTWLYPDFSYYGEHKTNRD